MQNKVKIAIAGLGSRGRNTYALRLHALEDMCEVVALAEPDEEAMSIVKNDHHVPDEMCFRSCEELLEKPRLADILFICTQDKQHAAQAVAALDKGYHLLLEKPIATTAQDCKKIQDAAHRNNRYVVVCHVLRYTPFYSNIKKVLETGVIGDIVTVNAIERVGYWHQAHSFVRGNWRNSTESSPMILAKCCHDMDILRWLIDKKCTRISSFGSLTHFKEENAPQGAALRCMSCPAAVRAECKFDAYEYYKKCFADGFAYGTWPASTITPIPTWENCKKALDEGPYGRCVYHCDNDVVDHQVVNMEFEGGVTCNFTMTAFTHNGSRAVNIMGTRGEIRADNDIGEENIIHVYEFGKPEYTIDINKLSDDLSGHGGGDMEILRSYITALYNGTEPSFSIDISMESHYMAFAAEESRIHNGAMITL